PLEMRRSYFDATPWHLIRHRSNNYRVEAGRPVANGLNFDTGITVSNGGLHAPVDDLARWPGFLMGAPGEAGPTYDMVLSRPALEAMWDAVVEAGDSPLGTEAVGLSFFLYHLDGHRLIGHTGFQKSFRAFILLDPRARVGVIGA